ncbi:hypothetical protein [Azospirillum sp. sgz301742]
MRLLALAIAASIATIVFTTNGRRTDSLGGLLPPHDGEGGITILDAHGRLIGTVERDNVRYIGREAHRAARAARFQRVFKDRD